MSKKVNILNKLNAYKIEVLEYNLDQLLIHRDVAQPGSAPRWG